MRLTFPPLIQKFIFTNTKFISELRELYSTKIFGKNILSLIFKWADLRLDDVFDDDRFDEVVLGVDMFSL
jgi:hypothetical protein